MVHFMYHIFSTFLRLMPQLFFLAPTHPLSPKQNKKPEFFLVSTLEVGAHGRITNIFDLLTEKFVAGPELFFIPSLYHRLKQ